MAAAAAAAAVVRGTGEAFWEGSGWRCPKEEAPAPPIDKGAPLFTHPKVVAELSTGATEGGTGSAPQSIHTGESGCRGA